MSARYAAAMQVAFPAPGCAPRPSCSSSFEPRHAMHMWQAMPCATANLILREIGVLAPIFCVLVVSFLALSLLLLALGLISLTLSLTWLVSLTGVSLLVGLTSGLRPGATQGA